MIRITSQLCSHMILSEDRTRLQSFTIKIDGEQHKQLMDLRDAAIADAQFQDLPAEEFPKVEDLLAAAISRGLEKMWKEL